MNAGGRKIDSLREYESPCARPPPCANSASTMSSPLPAIASREATMASIQSPVRPAPVPRFDTVQPIVTRAGSSIVCAGALTSDAARSA